MNYKAAKKAMPEVDVDKLLKDVEFFERYPFLKEKLLRAR